MQAIPFWAGVSEGVCSVCCWQLTRLALLGGLVVHAIEPHSIDAQSNVGLNSWCQSILVVLRRIKQDFRPDYTNHCVFLLHYLCTGAAIITMGKTANCRQPIQLGGIS